MVMRKYFPTPAARSNYPNHGWAVGYFNDDNIRGTPSVLMANLFHTYGEAELLADKMNAQEEGTET